MKFQPLALTGAYLVEPDPVSDSRGWFARTWCQEEFVSHGLDGELSQTNVSMTHQRGTIRGLHFQVHPFEEAKLVRCTRGCMYDVIVDIRDGSETRWQWEAVVLQASELRLLYIPAGFAHGFQTMVDETEVTYQMSQPYNSRAAAGLRWDDPRLGISWPITDPILSPRDKEYPLIDAQ
jgi:dTDP-4-dehydrorhamnose 3,5-epimerase